MSPLSEHFDLGELVFSQTAIRQGRPVEPSSAIIRNLERLCVMVLEPVRALWGKPVRISSGYRPIWLNRQIGGSETSEHVDGRAVDFTIPGVPVLEVCQRIEKELPGLPFNQLLYEFDAWTHLSICLPAQAPKRQILTARRINGVTRYLPGIVPKEAP